MDKKNYETDDQAVSHPSHYQGKNGLETIDVIEAFTDGLEGIEAVDTANVIKYICRWKQKNGIQDIEKAIWYATHLLNHLKGIDNKDMAKDVDDSVIEANAKANMDKIIAKACDGNNDEYIDILNKKYEENIDEKDTPVGETHTLTYSKIGSVKVLDSLLYPGEQSLTLIFAFYDDAKNFVECLKDYFDKTNEVSYISAATILRMVSPTDNEAIPIDVQYSRIGWFSMDNVSYHDNVVLFSNPKSVFGTSSSFRFA